MFKPWAMAVLAALLVVPGCADVRPPPPAAQRLAMSPPVLDEEEAVGAINAYRAAHSLAPLVLDARLSRAALDHSRDLARHDRIGHKGSDGTNPWQRVARAGYRPMLAAENVGAGQASFAEVLKGWQASRSHNRNLLLPDATQMGIALVHDPATRYRTFWTLVLGHPDQRQAGRL